MEFWIALPADWSGKPQHFLRNNCWWASNRHVKSFIHWGCQLPFFASIWYDLIPRAIFLINGSFMYIFRLETQYLHGWKMVWIQPPIPPRYIKKDSLTLLDIHSKSQSGIKWLLSYEKVNQGVSNPPPPNPHSQPLLFLFFFLNNNNNIRWLT